MLGGSDVIVAKMEKVIYLIAGGEKALRLTGRFEPLHLTLSSPGRLVQVLRSVDGSGQRRNRIAMSPPRGAG